MWKYVSNTLVAVIYLLSICTRSFAQNTNSGDIRGTVMDATGAVIPGTTVTVKDIDKGIVKVFQTDGAGLYDTGSIVPDHYVITFTKSGFSTFERGPITLDVSTQTIDGELKVGQDTQHVVVNADVPLLSTETGSLDATLSADTISQLPQTNLGADWENFIVLLPGATGAPENASSASNPSQNASINGNLPFDSVLADGATTTLPSSENSDVTIFETTAEVKISTSGFSAQYGQGGIIYNQITKGGTNQFHGAAYEYFSNDALNAFSYQFGATGVQLPRLRFNNFGFAVGGPSSITRHSSTSTSTRQSTTRSIVTTKLCPSPRTRPSRTATSPVPASRRSTTRRLKRSSTPAPTRTSSLPVRAFQPSRSSAPASSARASPMNITTATVFPPILSTRCRRIFRTS
jgi:hypothetical protein